MPSTYRNSQLLSPTLGSPSASQYHTKLYLLAKAAWNQEREGEADAQKHKPKELGPPL